MIRMPILPSQPQMSVDGRLITPEIISAVKTSDPSKRPISVTLNTNDAHSRDNSPVLGLVQKISWDDKWIYAYVEPSFGYENLLPQLASQSGPFPFRSISIEEIFVDSVKRPFLESISLVGSQKAAIQNLPPIETTSTFTPRQCFTVSFSSDVVAETPPTQSDSSKSLRQHLDETEQSLKKQIRQIEEQKIEAEKKEAEEMLAREAAEIEAAEKDEELRNEAGIQMRREFHTQSWLNAVQVRIPAVEDHFLREKSLGRVEGRISEQIVFETAADDVFSRAINARFHVLKNENPRNFLENDEADKSFLEELKADNVDKCSNEQTLRDQAVIRSDTWRYVQESFIKNPKVRK